MQVIDCVQGTPEWDAARRGIPTASCFSQILAKGEGKTRAAYMCRLAGEIITGQTEETFKSPEMLRGNVMEDEARSAYAFLYDADPQQVGFVREGTWGCSPDSFLGDDGILEIKTQKAGLLAATIKEGKFPSIHIAQCQGALLVTGRQWVDLCIYWPGMPLFVERAYRDEAYIANLTVELDRFNHDLNQLVNYIRGYGQARRAA